ncbi:hypothetical protein BN946_scf184801.g3 [Trametes cinnabarina]|uniref:D-lactate dehydrogenase (cytochrome) n=1 Tax=Pycnoporus cinnabarinus TaxID=5643 RepID=A0A060S8N3_PYCCI|nr:hypothetical protein BN946_scf184801.g3 [Trametes cinnabarina]
MPLSCSALSSPSALTVLVIRTSGVMQLSASSRALISTRLTSSTTRPLLTVRSRLLSRSSGSERARAYSTNVESSARASRNLPLAALLLAGGVSLGYYLATIRSDRAVTQNRARSDLNSTYGSPDDFAKAIDELRSTFPHEGAVTTDPEDLEVHGFSENDYHPSSHPSVVVFPSSTDDVVKIVKIAVKYKMPVIPYSGATSLEGHFRAPTVGGICVDLSQMDKIIEIHEADSDVVCQPGLRWMDLNEHLQKKGIPLFFPLDPAPGATIGGMLSTGCSGIVVTIRLAPVLPTNVAVVQFPDVRSATEAVIEVVNSGVGIQCVELCDDQFMRATNAYGMSTRKWPEKDSLFFKFQGPTPRSLQETADIVKKITAKHGGTGFSLARNDKEAHDLWMDRKNALYSSLAILPGARGWSTDVCVPISRLPDLVYGTKKDLEEHGLVSTIVGHVGDGNFHALLLFRNEEELEAAHAAVDRMVKRAIALDGTCTGEHGVGIGKRAYLYEELGEGTVELMKTIKKAIDPLNLFNPGKLYPDKPDTSKKDH